MIQARKSLGLKQSQLAEKAGITRSFLANIECGRHTPSLKVARKLSIALGGTIDDFFEDVVQKTNSA